MEMYKSIFAWVIAIISNPGKAWRELAGKEEKEEEFLSRFVYPLIGLVALASFFGVFFTQKDFSLQYALKSAIKSLIAYFCGFYLASYWLNELGAKLFGRERDLRLSQRFVGYSSSMMYALTIVLSILPVADFFFLRIFLFYTVYIVWEGAMVYYKVEEKDNLKFVLMASALIILLPQIIEILMFMLMPGMRV